MLIETFIRKQLGLKAHRVTAVAETESAGVISMDRVGKRRLRCGSAEPRSSRYTMCGRSAAGKI